MEAWIQVVTGAEKVEKPQSLETLWGGYGEILRATVHGHDASSVIVKHVSPGADHGLSHERKLRSYDVELAFYTKHAERLRTTQARIAHCHAAEKTTSGWRFLLEDLDAAGFDGRKGTLRGAHIERCLSWLASFHACFMNQSPEGLWPEGTYWHLETRPDELRALPDDRLIDAARQIDEKLTAARYRTFVHGDAKPANFCFGAGSVAAVDFQYVGAGCGMRDVAYLLFCRRGWGSGDDGAEPLLDFYFQRLRDALDKSVDADALEKEWRALYPVARADFLRFLAGWSPSTWSVRSYRKAVDAL